VLNQLAALLLGLLTGAMLLIGASLVPHWISLEPLEFTRSFPASSERIGRLMLPLGGLATVTVVLAAWLAAVRRVPGRNSLALAAVSALFIGAVYPLYFSSANAALGSGTLSPEEVTMELARWRTWHWARTTAGAVAFAAAIHALGRATDSRAE
jgi:hypothetical protein